MDYAEEGRILVVKQEGTEFYHTIQKAAEEAVPGDTILISGGVYREEVVLPRGGTEEASRITLKAADGEEVILSGAEPVWDGWEYHPSTGIHCLTLKKEYFSNHSEGEYFNPFAVYWKSKGPDKEGFFSCGCVYINEIVMQQTWKPDDVSARAYSWFADVNPDNGDTVIYANFDGANPCDPANHVEINVRMQCITAKWNQGYITIDGLKVIRGCGPKTIDFWMTTAEAMYGAVCTNGGHHWIIENCEVTQCRGVAIDFGCGSAKQELRYGGEPELYGYHILRYNHVHDNGTNGMMAYRGAYTEIHHNRLVNNNALNTGLASEAYIKDVSGGWGIFIHNNYFYSDQEWNAFPVWMDSECDMCRFSGNIIYCLGGEKGFSSLNYECNSGWNLIDNNILVGTGLSLCTTSNTYCVHNLWLNMDQYDRTWPPRLHTQWGGTEGFDGYSRSMRIVEPKTLKIIGKTNTSRWETFNHYNKMILNLFFDRGLTRRENNPFEPEDESGEGDNCYEASENTNSLYREMMLDTRVNEETRKRISNPDFSGGTWKCTLPSATEEDKEADRNYYGIYAWVPANEEEITPHLQQIESGNAHAPWGNECDYNAYYAGADKIDEPEYGAAHGYHADCHSVVSEGGSYHIDADPETFTLTIKVDDKQSKMEAPLATGSYLGAPTCYVQAAAKYVSSYQEADYLPDSVDRDFFDMPRYAGKNAAGPFADLKSGTSCYQCWPKSKI